MARAQKAEELRALCADPTKWELDIPQSLVIVMSLVAIASACLGIWIQWRNWGNRQPDEMSKVAFLLFLLGSIFMVLLGLILLNIANEEKKTQGKMHVPRQCDYPEGMESEVKPAFYALAAVMVASVFANFFMAINTSRRRSRYTGNFESFTEHLFKARVVHGLTMVAIFVLCVVGIVTKSIKVPVNKDAVEKVEE